jgi:hypothetical protein
VWFQIPSAFLYAVSGLVFFFSVHNIWLAFACAVCVSMLVAIPVDRYIEDKLRELRPLEERKGEKGEKGEKGGPPVVESRKQLLGGREG